MLAIHQDASSYDIIHPLFLVVVWNDDALISLYFWHDQETDNITSNEAESKKPEIRRVKGGVNIINYTYRPFAKLSCAE